MARTLSLTSHSIILGLVAAVGPFAIDMYLPAMPAIGAELGASMQAVQWTIVAYFIAFGLAQLIYGPWADQAGRKPPLYTGLALFMAGTVVCAVAPSIGWLIAGRILQGLGGAANMVVLRAVIRDLATGPAATRMMSTIMIVIAVSPLLAPLSGSALLTFGSWRLIFWALLLAAGLSFFLIHFALPETLSPANRQRFDARTMLVGVGQLLRDKPFMVMTFLAGFAFASFFVFIASASFVYTQEFGLGPTEFSFAFAISLAIREHARDADGDVADDPAGDVRVCTGDFCRVRPGAGGAGYPARHHDGTVYREHLPGRDPAHSASPGAGGSRV
jgi:MFS transporter, DHA1 family, multidrug resistance protein